MNYKKGSTTTLILSIVIIILIGIIIIIQSGEKGITPEISQNEEKKEQEELADWKIYTNEKYGFKLNCPSHLTVKDWAYQTPNFELLIYIGENKDIGDGAVSIGIEKEINNLKQLYQKSFAPEIQEEDLKNVQIGKENYNAKKFSYKGESHELPEDSDFLKYFIEHFDNLYQIHYDRKRESSISENDFNHILSTFQFIE